MLGRRVLSFSGQISRRHISVVSPATKQVVAELNSDTAETVKQKAKNSRVAQSSWKNVPLSERIAAIKQFRDALANPDTIAQFAQDLSAETGKPVSQAAGEIKGTLGRIDFFTEHVENVLQPVNLPVRGGVEERIEYEPLGVVGNISAWNYPYFVGSNVFIPALLTGNSVLYKPSEFALLTGRNIHNLLNKFLPENVFTVLVGDGSVGAAMLQPQARISDRLVDAVFFTGSNATGLKIAELGAKSLLKVQLELGGKDGAYVHHDVPIDDAAAGLADGVLYNNGQGCCSVERIFVNERIYDQFVSKLVSSMAEFKLGDPSKDDTYIGPLTRPQQADVLDDQVRDAVQKGAKLLLGGKRKTISPLQGVFYEPTVLDNTNNSMKVAQEESFGPIVAVQKVPDNLDAAVAALNDCQYGLTNSVYTKDASVAEYVSKRVNSGTAYWNCCDRVSPQLPWAGRFGSGVGYTLGEGGIATFVQPKAYHWKSQK